MQKLIKYSSTFSTLCKIRVFHLQSEKWPFFKKNLAFFGPGLLECELDAVVGYEKRSVAGRCRRCKSVIYNG